MAYLAAVMAHPAFTARFQADLVRPGLRVPLTADAKLFAEAVALGREVIWLHSYGERMADPRRPAGRSRRRACRKSRADHPGGRRNPSAPEPLPDTMDYDPADAPADHRQGLCRERHAGNVGLRSLRQAGAAAMVQLSQQDRSRPIIGDRRPPSPLDNIQPDHWLAEYTTDLLDLLHVLGRLIALEPTQADLLDRICASRLLSADELRDAGAFANVDEKSAPPKSKSKSKA